MVRPQRFGPWRRSFQWSLAAILLITPFLSVNGIAMCRVDIPALTLELSGHRFRIEELSLLWLFVLALTFLFILVTLLLGRVWCGWACPQTLLSDLADWLDKQVAGNPIRYPIYLGVSLWAGATCTWYFVSPWEYARLLTKGQLGMWPLGATLTVACLALADLLFVRRLFCRAFCPYGRFQAIIQDRGTLTLQAAPGDLRRCIGCNACLRVCPTGIDIRQGYQIECINCARCLDACRQAMAKRGQAGIIRYTFGQDDLGWHAAICPKSVAIGLIALLLAASFLFSAGHRPAASFEIGRASNFPSRLTDNGRQSTFFSASIANRREREQEFILSVAGAGDSGTMTIKGPTRFTLAGNEKRNLTLAIDSPMVPGPAPMPVLFTLQSRQGDFRVAIQAYLAPVLLKGTTPP